MSPADFIRRKKIKLVSPLKTGSKAGELNRADRIWVRVRYSGAFAWTVLLGLAGQVQQVLPTVQGSWPVWLVVILGGLAAAIVRIDTLGLQRRADTTAPSAPPAVSNAPPPPPV